VARGPRQQKGLVEVMSGKSRCGVQLTSYRESGFGTSGVPRGRRKSVSVLKNSLCQMFFEEKSRQEYEF
jgi:hypothetical protein